MIMNGDGAMEPVLDLPEAETIEKIDYVIQGLQNGQFKELTKKIDFHQKLKGEEAIPFVQSLIDVIKSQAIQLSAMHDRLDREQDNRFALENRVSELEVMLQNYTKNLRGIANGLAILADPKPPLAGGLEQGATRWYNEADAEQFISEYKDKY